MLHIPVPKNIHISLIFILSSFLFLISRNIKRHTALTAHLPSVICIGVKPRDESVFENTPIIPHKKPAPITIKAGFLLFV